MGFAVLGESQSISSFTSTSNGVDPSTAGTYEPPALPLNLSPKVAVVEADVATLLLLLQPLPHLSPAEPCAAPVTFVRHSLGSLLITISAIAAAVAPSVAASAAEHTAPLLAVVVDEDVEEADDEEMVEPGNAETGVAFVEMVSGDR